MHTSTVALFLGMMCDKYNSVDMYFAHRYLSVFWNNHNMLLGCLGKCPLTVFTISNMTFMPICALGVAGARDVQNIKQLICMQLIRQAHKSLMNYVIDYYCDVLQQGKCRRSAGFRGSDSIDRGDTSMHITSVTCWVNISLSKGVLWVSYVCAVQRSLYEPRTGSWLVFILQNVDCWTVFDEEYSDTRKYQAPIFNAISGRLHWSA